MCLKGYPSQTSDLSLSMTRVLGGYAANQKRDTYTILHVPLHLSWTDLT